MPLQDLTTPPTAPSRSDDAETFIERADAFVAWFGTFVGEMQTLTAELEATAALIAAAPAYADPGLVAMTGKTPASDRFIYFDGASTSALATLTAFGRTLAALADAAALRTAASVYSTSQVDSAIATAVTGLLDFKGSTDCSGNPNYPSASKGDAYIVSVAGKIGGASGKSVDVGDVYVASADNAGGTEASVGTSWFVLEHNLAGALLAANNLSDVANAATARSNLGAQAQLTFTSDANGIAIGFVIGGTTYYIQAGTKTQGANSDGTITYPVAFTTAAYCVCIGGPSGSGDAGSLHTRGASGLTTQNVSNTSGGASITGNWIAIGY